MMKANGVARDGSKVLLIGLSDRNAEMLIEGRPIVIAGDEFGGVAGVTVIVTAQDEDGMSAMPAEYERPAAIVVLPVSWLQEAREVETTIPIDGLNVIVFRATDEAALFRVLQRSGALGIHTKFKTTGLPPGALRVFDN